MNSLPVKILAAVLAFAIGVGVDRLCFNIMWSLSATPNMCPLPVSSSTRFSVGFRAKQSARGR